MNIIDMPEASDSIRNSLLFTENIYRIFDNKAAAFAAENKISCPQGCGQCCRDFEPEISSLEALYIAAWIIRSGAKLSGQFNILRERKNCIFYDDNSEYHCMIYPARPLLCRAFAFSGIRDKYGIHKYRSCKYMGDKREFSGADIPDMTEEGNALRFYSGQDEKPVPLSVAAEKAWEKLSFFLIISALDSTPGVSPQAES